MSEHEPVDVELEIDEVTGESRWVARDPELPGSESFGQSIEEAMEGLDERRKAFRKMKEERNRRRRSKGGE